MSYMPGYGPADETPRKVRCAQFGGRADVSGELCFDFEDVGDIYVDAGLD